VETESGNKARTDLSAAFRALEPGGAGFPSPGRWAVAVSGGADSVALLLLLAERGDLSLHVVHLDHQLRGNASDEDAKFVADLAADLKLPCTIARRDEIEPELRDLPANPSARYRAVRMELFRRTIAVENLDGVLLAHHADDQAETILLRLLRGAGPGALAGMSARRKLAGIEILRPLLATRRVHLLDFLNRRGQTWREDASNQSDDYARNRVRKFLQATPELVEPLLNLGSSSRDLIFWARQSAPKLAMDFPAKILAALPRILARQSARRWLLNRGAPPGELTAAVLDRLCLMAADAATASYQDFPGMLRISRRRGRIAADS
jgi:tRNA(Ile)-lysidine synthase